MKDSKSSPNIESTFGPQFSTDAKPLKSFRPMPSLLSIRSLRPKMKNKLTMGLTVQPDQSIQKNSHQN
jgi:hypothetical protein